MVPAKENVSSSDAQARDEAFVAACANLDPHEEQEFAEIGVNLDLAEWPEY